MAGIKAASALTTEAQATGERAAGPRLDNDGPITEATLGPIRTSSHGKPGGSANSSFGSGGAAKLAL
jgi:hypothetical protein